MRNERSRSVDGHQRRAALLVCSVSEVSRAADVLAVFVLCWGCTAPESASEGPPPPDAGNAADASADADAADAAAPFACPTDGVRGRGDHRLFVQGHGAAPDAAGADPRRPEWAPARGAPARCAAAVLGNAPNGDGVWEPGEEPKPLGPDALVHGEHFLVGAGAFAEFRTVLCDDITGDVVFYIPNYDEAGSQALHELFVVHEGQELLVASAVDDEAGQSGYNPFVRVLAGVDPDAAPGDTLLLRSTNLNGVPFSVMVWQPPSEYESWLRVEVP